MNEEIKIENAELERETNKQQFVVPKSRKNLRACYKCGLIKSHGEWVIEKNCQNCGPFRKLTMAENVSACNAHSG